MQYECCAEEMEKEVQVSPGSEPEEAARRGLGSTGTGVTVAVTSPVWMLGTKPRSSTKAANA